MNQTNNNPRILTIKEFRKEFNIKEDGLSVGKYKNGNYGWRAITKNGDLLHGPVSKKLIERDESTDLVFVEYHWDNNGMPLLKPLWVLQKRPTPHQIEKTQALYFLLGEINNKKKELCGKKCIPFTINQLSFQLSNCKKNDCYFEFSIPKKNGKLRKISAPNRELKFIQNCINLIFQEKYRPTAAAMGFVPGRSVADNASVHQGQKYVYNIDLKDFFSSITEGRVFTILQQKPYSFDKARASIIADLCCFNGSLPQGAPTSPILTNIICERLDWRLAKLAKHYNLKYSRYADDISFSGMENVFHADGDFVQRLHHYIDKEGFTINPDKTRLNTTNSRQEVTGLTVNERPNVSKQYIKTLRTMIHNWEKYGLEESQNRMALVLQKAGKRFAKGVPQIANVIQGKLNYLKMIKGGSDSTYVKLNNRYQTLLYQECGVNRILEIWEKDGLEAASKELFKRFPYEKEYKNAVWTLSEFENIIKGRICINLKKSYYSVSINNQEYWGKIHLVAHWALDVTKDIFVSYGDYLNKKCFMFSNVKGHLIGGKLYTDEQIKTMIYENFGGKRSLKFILEYILKQKSLTHEDFQKRTDLIIKMIESVSDVHEKLFDEMGNENKLDIVNDSNNTVNFATSNQKKINSVQNAIIHDPIKVVERMKLFTKEGYLKYSTHIWDYATDGTGFEFTNLDDFIEKYTLQVGHQFKEITERYNTPLGRILYNFLFSRDADYGWGKYNIKVGYQKPCSPIFYLKKWMDENPDKRPTAMPLSYFPTNSFPTKVNGRSLAYFEDIVNIFKDSIQFRGNNLFYLCESIGRSSNIRINEEKLSTLRGMSFFTDTWVIEQVIDIIISNFKNRSHYPDIEISAQYTNDNSRIVIGFLQKESYSDADIENDKKLNLTDEVGEMIKIREKLRGLCDWSIESRFHNSSTNKYEYWRIEYLYYNEDSNSSDDNVIKIEPRKVPIENAEGFKHILTFYL